MSKNLAVHFESSRYTGNSEQDRWGSPQNLFESLNNYYEFAWDAAADSQNTMTPHFFSTEDDALTEDWSIAEGSIWLNPPYSRIKAFSEKAYKEAYENNQTIVMLVPARTDTVAFHEYLCKGKIWFLKGRLKYLKGGIETNFAPFPSMIVELSPEAFAEPSMDVWDHRKDKFPLYLLELEWS